jgi:hypothetical protein
MLIVITSIIRSFTIRVAFCLIFVASAQAQGNVSPPNGTHSQHVVDLVVQSSLGAVEWKRVFNGSGWRFNRHWDGINASFKPVTMQNTGGGAPGQIAANSSGGESAVCWIWVDEDWKPGDGALITPVTQQQPRTVGPDEYIPPNNAYNQTAAPLDTALSSFFSACASSGGNITGGNGSDITQVFEGFRRQSQLYVGSGLWGRQTVRIVCYGNDKSSKGGTHEDQIKAAKKKVDDCRAALYKCTGKAEL